MNFFEILVNHIFAGGTFKKSARNKSEVRRFYAYGVNIGTFVISSVVMVGGISMERISEGLFAIDAPVVGNLSVFNNHGSHCSLPLFL
jgi:hypothetical protein